MDNTLSALQMRIICKNVEVITRALVCPVSYWNLLLYQLDQLVSILEQVKAERDAYRKALELVVVRSSHHSVGVGAACCRIAHSALADTDDA